MGMLSAALLSAAMSMSLAAPNTQPTAEGLWEKLGTSGQPEAWFRIRQCGGLYQGRIVKIFRKGSEDPSTWRCTKCEGDQKDAPVVGITFIRNMRKHGLTYEDGSILDPRDGAIYSAMMQLSPDGRRLTVRGYLGIPMLGQSEVWHRLPADTTEAGKSPQCSHASSADG